MSFHEMFKDAEFNGESHINYEVLEELKRHLSDPGVQEYLEIVFNFMNVYYRIAKDALDEEMARDIVLMVFARWLEEGRLI